MHLNVYYTFQGVPSLCPFLPPATPGYGATLAGWALPELAGLACPLSTLRLKGSRALLLFSVQHITTVAANMSYFALQH